MEIASSLADGKKVVLASEDGLGMATLEVSAASDEQVLMLVEGPGVTLETQNDANVVVEASDWQEGLHLRIGSLEIRITHAPSKDSSAADEAV